MANAKVRLSSLYPNVLRNFASRMETSSFGARLTRGMIWNLAGNLISRGSMLLASVFVARIIGKIGFGELGIVQSTIGMFGAFAGLGLGLTATKYVAEYRGQDPAKAGRIIVLTNVLGVVSGGLLAAVLYISAPWLAARTLAAPHLSGILRVGAGLLFFGAVNGALTGVLSGFEAFRAIATVNLGAGIAAFALIVGGAHWAGLNGAVWGLTAGMVITMMLNYLAVRRAAVLARVPLAYSSLTRELPVLWKYSLPALLSSIVVVPATWAGNAILVNRADGYAEMGIFNAANQWFMALMFLPAIIIQVILPMMSERYGHADHVQSGRILRLSLKMNMLLVFPLIIIGCGLSPFLMALNGPGFRDSGPTLVVVLFTAGLVAVQWPAYTVLQAAGKMWGALVMNMGWAAVFVLGAFFLCRFGSLGLSLSRAIAYALHTLWTFAYLNSFQRSSGSRAAKSAGAPEIP